ncbi:MAG TPA: helix-turn-helix domain-containing protein [Gemmatimonadales bacterium]|nr:helix-turn-helix domain-containing protein [Gemmatimonadales bacterium]
MSRSATQAKRLRHAAPTLSPIVRAVLEARDESIAVFDADGRVLFLNARATVAHGTPNGAPNATVLRAKLLASHARAIRLEAGGAVLGEILVVPRPEPRLWVQREREAIHETLTRSGGKRGETARQLGISRTTLWRRLRQHPATNGHG